MIGLSPLKRAAITVLLFLWYAFLSLWFIRDLELIQNNLVILRLIIQVVTFFLHPVSKYCYFYWLVWNYLCKSSHKMYIFLIQIILKRIDIILQIHNHRHWIWNYSYFAYTCMFFHIWCLVYLELINLRKGRCSVS